MPALEDLRRRHNVADTGQGRPVLLLHGYATNQEVWRHVAPQLEHDHRVIRLDNAGSGGSDRSAWDPERHASLEGYADDVNAVVDALDLHDVVVVGHSAGAMIGALATVRRPERYGGLVMIATSARYLDADGYVGGFSREELEDLLETLDSDFAGWAAAMAPSLAGSAQQELEQLMTTEHAAHPEVPRYLLDDHRDALGQVPVPALVMQSPQDPFVPFEVGRYVERRLPEGHLVRLGTPGHFPVLTAPDEVVAAIRAFILRA